MWAMGLLGLLVGVGTGRGHLAGSDRPEFGRKDDDQRALSGATSEGEVLRGFCAGQR